MLRHRIIPVLLLKNYGLVKTIKFRSPTYIGDPVNAVRIFNEKEVDELILLDITATVEKKEPNYSKIEEIVSEAFMPIGYGGGINSIYQIERLIKLGIEKIIINSSVYGNYSLLKEASNIFGNQSIVLSIDINKDFFGNYKLFSNSGKFKQKINIKEHLEKSIDHGCGEIFINYIGRDGTMTGYEIDLLREFADYLKLPVVICGGAGKIEDFANAIQNGADAVAAGSMFVFQGNHRAVLISYPKYSELEKIL